MLVNYNAELSICDRPHGLQSLKYCLILYRFLGSCLTGSLALQKGSHPHSSFISPPSPMSRLLGRSFPSSDGTGFIVSLKKGKVCVSDEA